MSKISIACAHPASQFEIVKFLHQRLKLSLAEAKQTLALGSKGTFYSCELYGNDHVQRDKDLRDIIDFFEAHNTPLLILEMGYDTNGEDLDIQQLDHCIMPVQHLLNALDTAQGQYQ